MVIVKGILEKRQLFLLPVQALQDHSSGDLESEQEVTRFFETSITVYQSTQHQVAEEFNDVRTAEKKASNLAQ